MRARLIAAGLAAATAMLGAGSADAAHYKVWIKAFIPNTGLDIVMPVPGGAGKSMIPGPHVAGVPIDPTCYNTNNRGFDPSPNADAKVTAMIEFDLLAPGVSGVRKPAPVIGETLQYDCASGAVLNRKTAAADAVSVGDPVLNGASVSIQFDGQATNPLAPGPAALAPAINFHGKFTIDTSARTISFDGGVRRFPSYEAYLQVDGSTTTVFRIAPASDASAWSLYLPQAVSRSASY